MWWEWNGSVGVAIKRQLVVVKAENGQVVPLGWKMGGSNVMVNGFNG
jgi:hypothetical protein